jgi:hypothetical protein
VDVLVVVALDWMLLRRLSLVIDIHRPTVEAAARKQFALPARRSAQIEAMRGPAAFVTEQTTRMFEPSAGERNK